MIEDVLKPLAAVLVLWGGALNVAAHAQAPGSIEDLLRSVDAVEQDADADAYPAMWRVADADSEYILLGSFHILPPELDWRSPLLDDALQNADVVYFEVEADTANARAQTLNMMMLRGFNPPGVTLSDMLDEADAAKLRSIASDLQLPIAAIDPMRPWQAFLTLSVQLIAAKGFEPGAGVDAVLVEEARAFGKPLRFFETLEEQILLFADLDPQMEKDLLVLTIRDWDHELQSFDALFDAWRVGDTALIDREVNQQTRDKAPEVYARLFTDRNQRWADELSDALRSGADKALVVVGAGHLVGADSVPSLLQAQGFDVSRYGVDAD